MVQRWLFKTEPGSYSFDDLERDGKTTWDGVKNPVARKHLRKIAKGDAILVYHTGDEKAVIGIAKAASGAYADPKSKDAGAVVVDIVPGKRMRRPVTLAEVKAHELLAKSPLARLPRLSVMPLTSEEWTEIERIATR